MAKIVETPLMKQYFDIKAKHPDAILLFRVGDFYEMYGEDAVTGAEILGIVQTKKANGPGQTIETGKERRNGRLSFPCIGHVFAQAGACR